MKTPCENMAGKRKVARQDQAYLMPMAETCTLPVAQNKNALPLTRLHTIHFRKFL
jgi:hypothetical protein